MYTSNEPAKTSIRVNKSYPGERLEEKVNRIVNNKEPIKDGAPLVYTDRADGVLPSTDIRTDRFEIAVEAMDKVAEQKLTNRRTKFEKKLEETNKSEGKDPGGEKTDPKVGDNKGEKGSPGGGETKG